MKILTLNTHSLQEDNYDQKLDQFVQGILREKPDIIAMQEVNQTAGEAPIDPAYLEGQYPIPSTVTIRRDNHAANVAYRLRQAGVRCWWTWLPIKLGYSKYDEGVAILSLGRPIRCADHFPISKVVDYSNWRTRAVLGVQVEGLPDWFYTVHMGWWDDPEEPFLDQWKKLNCCIASQKLCDCVWLMGDFNAPDLVRGESYDAIASSGWLDTYHTARIKGSGTTVPGVIDGWRDRLGEQQSKGMRLDHIWCSWNRKITSSEVFFNGTNYPIVSDHFGVMVTTKE